MTCHETTNAKCRLIESLGGCGRWLSLDCLMCVVMLLPTTGLVPLSFLQQSTVEFEEDVESEIETDSEATEDRRKFIATEEVRTPSFRRRDLPGVPAVCQTVDNRSEYASHNGAGTALRC